MPERPRDKHCHAVRGGLYRYELSHHAHIFMFQHVAMKHEWMAFRRFTVEMNQYFSLPINQSRILPARLMCGGRFAILGKNAKRRPMDMEWMRHLLRCKFPDFPGPKLGLDIDTTHVERFACDRHRYA